LGISQAVDNVIVKLIGSDQPRVYCNFVSVLCSWLS